MRTKLTEVEVAELTTANITVNTMRTQARWTIDMEMSIAVSLHDEHRILTFHISLMYIMLKTKLP